MKKLGIMFVLLCLSFSSRQLIAADQITIDLARMFSRDIFELNGIPYLKPMVESINATSNSRFFNQAFIPSEVEKPYFKVGIHGMLGFVRDDQKTYKPTMPSQAFNFNDLAKYGTFQIDILHPENSIIIINDTAGLIYYALKTVVYRGIEQNRIPVPDKAATILGNRYTQFILNTMVLDSLVKEDLIFGYLPKGLQDTILTTISQFPTNFTLPQGGNINTMIAGVPQIEIGSLWGTELLIRFIPPVNLGENIGDFAFWGLGLKHSITQYFENPPLDLAVQGVYQGTHLKNKIGVTNSELTANATILNFNINASKNFKDIIEVYSGFSFEYIQINSEFKYYLPVEVQAQLGMLRYDPSIPIIYPPEPPEYPGDTDPQTAVIELNDNNFKWVIGLAKQVGPVRFFLDFNISKFNIFTGGIEYRF